MARKRSSRRNLESALSIALTAVSASRALDEWASRALAAFTDTNQEASKMDHAHTTLAEIDGFGRVYRCGSCEHIHLQFGPVNLTLTPQAYMQFVAMVNSSAARFETTANWGLEEL